MNFDVPFRVLTTVPAPIFVPLEDGRYEHRFSDQLRMIYDPQQKMISSRWTSQPRPCFNPALLADLRAYTSFVAGTRGSLEINGERHPIEYVVEASDMPGVFNLGGDLELFKRLIAEADRDGLLRYGRACVDVLYPNYRGYDMPCTTVSLVQGECLGGGFEAALSSDVIVAEKGARFGFPETLFNLFPGMGAFSFLEVKVGAKTAEKLIMSGQIYSAEQMHDMGVVDVVAEDGEGDAALADLVRRRGRQFNSYTAMAAVRRTVKPVSFEQLMDVVEIWVDAALRLTPRDLKLMQRLVGRQNGIQEPATSASVH
jgi:DSF synthase